MTLSERIPSGRPRLLIINNMPAFYRTAPFASLVEQFAAATGGVGMVAYQVRRDPYGRGEWFFTPDAELPYPHHFASPETRSSSRRTAYPVRLDAGLWARYRPTHVFAAGWDSPLSMTAALWARAAKAILGTWVESNSTTSKLKGGPADLFRRTFLRSADFVVVPTGASRTYVHSLARRQMPTFELKNPVVWSRIPDGKVLEPPPRRAVFLGDLSARKGFDHFMTMLERGASRGWTGMAWGRDTEGLASGAPQNLQVFGSRPLAEVVPDLLPTDVMVIPSRVDPAPLTYSEALALGLRVLVSTSIAYAVDAARGDGTRAFDAADPETALLQAEQLVSEPRPDVGRSHEVRPDYWASGVLRGLIGTPQNPSAGSAVTP